MKRELLIGTVTDRVLDAVPGTEIKWWKGILGETACVVVWPWTNGLGANQVDFCWVGASVSALPDDLAEQEAQRVVDIAKAGVR